MNNREQRAAIAQDTLAVLERGFYTSNSGQKVQITAMQQAAVAGSIHYTTEVLNQIAAQTVPQARFETIIDVCNESTLSAARRLYVAGHNDVLCLNFASARNPGGGFLGGSEAQEENLAKSSGLYPCLAQMSAMYEANRAMKFCAYLDDMIYSPAVPVFRNDDYRYLDSPYPVSIITAPAVNYGAVARNEPQRIDELEAIMQRRINLLLSLAYHHGHTALVLGAWGCGVFGNQPQDMAHWFAQKLLVQQKFYGAFQHIIFAVLDRRDNGTYRAFAETFAK